MTNAPTRRRAPDLPLEIRRTVGMRIAVAMLVGAPVSLVVAVALGDTADVRWHVLQTALLTGLAAAILVGLPRTSGRRTELVLAGLALGLLASVLVGGLAARADSGRVAALAFLALALLITSLTLRRRMHDLALLATLAVAPITTLAAGTEGRIAGWMLFAGITVGVLSRLTATALARTVAARHRAERRATEHAAAMAAVLQAVRTTVGATPDEIMQTVVDATAGLGADRAALYLVRPDGMLGLAATRNMPEGHRRTARPPGQGLPGEVLRRTALVHLEDYQDFDEAVPSLLDAGIRVAVGVPVRLPDGRVLAVLTAGRRDPQPFGQAALHAFEVLADDIARALESSRAVDADRRTLRAVTALHERQTDFVATVSHELRTPVTIIGGMATTLHRLGDDVSTDLRREMTDRIHRHAQALGDVVEGLLDAARLDGGISARLAEVDLAGLADASLGQLHLPLHPVSFDASGDAVVRGDQHLLAAVLENLVDNAATHTPPGTAIRIAVHGDGQRVRLEVADDGPGIPAAHVHRITERFVRAGDLNTRETRGLGIGLAFVNAVLRLHDTTLEVVSQEGQGASFSFSLTSARPRTARTASPLPLRRPG